MPTSAFIGTARPYWRGHPFIADIDPADAQLLSFVHNEIIITGEH